MPPSPNVHAATILFSRTRLVPEFLRWKPLRSWVQDAFNYDIDKEFEARAYGEIEDFDRTIGHVPGLGAALSTPPGRTDARGFWIQYEHAVLAPEPLYVVGNWKITWLNGPSRAKVVARVRGRIHACGACSAALYLQVLSDIGIPLDKFCLALRQVADENPAEAGLFRVTTTTAQHELTAAELLELALAKILRSTLDNPPTAPSVTAAPDYLILDVGKTTPPLVLPDDDDVLARVLMLDMSAKRQIRHKRQPGLAMNVTDWLGANSRLLLFTDTEKQWPRKKSVTKDTRSSGRVVWRFFNLIELVLIQKLLTSYLNRAFESAALEMAKAKHKSKAFLRTTLKSTFYNETSLALSTDLQHIREQLRGRDLDLYDYLAIQFRLKEAADQLKASETRFLAAVETWKPGASKLLDMVKLLPK